MIHRGPGNRKESLPELFHPPHVVQLYSTETACFIIYFFPFLFVPLSRDFMVYLGYSHFENVGLVIFLIKCPEAFALQEKSFIV